MSSPPHARVSRRRRCSAARATIVILALLAPRALLSQELPAERAGEFLGDWTLALEIQGNPVEMTLRIADEEGKAVAYLSSPRSPEPQRIDDLARDGENLVLTWQRDLGGQLADLHLVLRAGDDGLTGDFGDATGFFSATVAAQRAAAASGDAAGDAAAPRRRPSSATEAQLQLEAGRIRVSFEPLDEKRNASDLAALEELASDRVFSFAGGRAIKLLSEPSLRFGEVTVATGNAAPDYPGVYSLWLRRTTPAASASGWELVFNEHADIWGTQHDPEVDVASVPLTHAITDAAQPKLEVSLAAAPEGGANAGTLTIAWAGHRWSTDFVAVP